jgi:pyrroline-5-carboxylate reductase
MECTTLKKIAVIGAGQMAEALIGGLLACRADAAAHLFVTDPVAARRDVIKARFDVRVGEDNLEAVSWADVVLLAIKPQVFDTVLQAVAPRLTGHLVISIAAGVPIHRIQSHIAGQVRIVRVMPNAPAVVREGVSVLAFGQGVTEADRALVLTLFQSVGRVVALDERLMDAVTGLSGSGPAFIFMAIEALADGGVKAGLSRTIAEQLAAQTVLGAARMVLETGKHPAQLKDMVASPGGTTIAGLHELELGGLRACLIAAVEAASQRSAELGR